MIGLRHDDRLLGLEQGGYNGHGSAPRQPETPVRETNPPAPDPPRESGHAGRSSKPTAPPAADTLLLLRRIRSGDEEALETLCRRYLPRLRRWAAGRLPSSARDLLDTQDLVQETMIRAINRLPEFEPRHDGALQAYLREAILNRIRDEIRRTRSHPDATGVDSQVVDPGPTPLEEAVGQDCAERYERALGRLKADDQEAILLRIELGYGYQQIAEALGKPSADAARMAVSRALVRLAEEMRDHAG